MAVDGTGPHLGCAHAPGDRADRDLINKARDDTQEQGGSRTTRRERFALSSASGTTIRKQPLLK